MFISFHDFLIQSPSYFYTIITLLGLTVGSFLNVVIHRLPRMLDAGWKAECELLFADPEELAKESTIDSEKEKVAKAAPPKKESYNLAFPNSHCPQCQHELASLDNIPVVSYLFLKGRCRYCQTPISKRYPIIESVTALLSVIVATKFGVSQETIAALLLTWGLICLTMIDFDTQFLPDDITLPLMWLGIFSSFFLSFASLQDAVIGAMAGYLSLWCVYWAFKLMTDKEGMGYGDFKLLAMLGAWLGWQYLPLVIILSSLVGSIVGLSMIAFYGKDKNIPIAFGPYLAAAGWITLIWGDVIMNRYLAYANVQ